MKSIRYELSHTQRQALVCDCAAAAEAAAIALARFDERLLRVEPILGEGARQRGHAFEAQALIGLTGGLCPLEDLVLHDAGMDVSTGTEVSPDVGFQNSLLGRVLVSGISRRRDRSGSSLAGGRGVWAPVAA